MTQIERPERRVDDVAAHIPQSALAEIPPAAQFERMIRLMIRSHRRRADPQVPVNAAGDRWCVGGAADALRPDRAVGPRVNLAHRAEDARLNPFDGGAE